jgi:hypothetical protein
MTQLRPEYSIVPIIRCSEQLPIKEVLGTGFFVGQKNKPFIVTAKHVFEDNPLRKEEKYGYVFKGEKSIQVYSIPKIFGAEGNDVSVFEAAVFPEAVPLAFSKKQPALNDDVLCYEYSGTRIEKTQNSGTKVIFEPLAHKGNIMRYFDSEYPEKHKTSSFIVSFPALQGASGAPVLAGMDKKSFYVAGMIVANQERHLLPAQVVKIQDGEKYMEETSYFLPLGKALNSSVIVPILQGLSVEIEIVE